MLRVKCLLLLTVADTAYRRGYSLCSTSYIFLKEVTRATPDVLGTATRKFRKLRKNQCYF